jgi:hypothetical protein
MPGSIRKLDKLSGVGIWISDELSEAHFHLSNPRHYYPTVYCTSITFQFISSLSILRQLTYWRTPAVWSTFFQFFRKFHLSDKHNLNINTSVFPFSPPLQQNLSQMRHDTFLTVKDLQVPILFQLLKGTYHGSV